MNEKYGYVLLKCDGTVEVVECELACDCRLDAIKRKGFFEPDEELEPILSIGGRKVCLNVLNDVGETANRAASGIIDGGCTGDAIICDFGKVEGRSEVGYIPLPIELAEFVANFARSKMTSEEEWNPNGTVREGFLESLVNDLGNVARKFEDTSLECATAQAGMYLVGRLKRRIEELKNSDGEEGNRVLGELLTIAYGRCTP